jgi:hypothetical protein
MLGRVGLEYPIPTRHAWRLCNRLQCRPAAQPCCAGASACRARARPLRSKPQLDPVGHIRMARQHKRPGSTSTSDVPGGTQRCCMAASRRAECPGSTGRLLQARRALGAPRKGARLQQPLAAVARGRHRRLDEPRRGRVVGARHVGHAPAVALHSTAILGNASNMQHTSDATPLHTCSTGTASG